MITNAELADKLRFTALELSMIPNEGESPETLLIKSIIFFCMSFLEEMTEDQRNQIMPFVGLHMNCIYEMGYRIGMKAFKNES